MSRLILLWPRRWWPMTFRERYAAKSLRWQALLCKRWGRRWQMSRQGTSLTKPAMIRLCPKLALRLALLAAKSVGDVRVAVRQEPAARVRASPLPARGGRLEGLNGRSGRGHGHGTSDRKPICFRRLHFAYLRAQLAYLERSFPEH